MRLLQSNPHFSPIGRSRAASPSCIDSDVSVTWYHSKLSGLLALSGTVACSLLLLVLPQVQAAEATATATASSASSVSSAASAATPANNSTSTATEAASQAAPNSRAEPNIGDAASASVVNNGAESAVSACINSFKETRDRVMSTNTQSVILLSSANGISPYITLQSAGDNDSHYVLWQTLNGDIRGYALRNGKGFDYANSANMPLPLSWHPTLIWDKLFGSRSELKNYSCVLTGRTRVMGKRVSLLRLVPQEGLRYTYMLAKEDESDFPVELSIIDPKGTVVSRLTTMDSRIIAGYDFPISDLVFDRIASSQQQQQLQYQHEASAASSDVTMGPSLNMQGGNSSSTSLSSLANDEVASSLNSLDENPSSLELMLPAPTGDAGATFSAGAGNAASASTTASTMNSVRGSMSGGGGNATSAGMTQGAAKKLVPWKELTIPKVFTIVGQGSFEENGETCIFQEFSDGISSFKVYRNQRSTIFYPVLNNGALSIVRKNSMRYEYSVVGDVPVTLAEYVLARING